MKKIFVIVGLICLTALGVGSADALTLSFANLPANPGLGDLGGQIKFVGTNAVDTLEFTNATTGPGSGYSFSIDGLYGKIIGPFAIGTVTIGSGGYESAPVTGTGTLDIFDNAVHLTANLSWIDGATVGGGTFGLLNLSGVTNLTNLQYAGSNTTLQNLYAIGHGDVVASFTFSPARSLTDLKATGAVNVTTYSGTLSAVPLPGALVLLGAGLVRLVTYSRRKRALA
jgi:hypothetical protein